MVQTKEKFGAARVYCYFGVGNLHNLLYPGYVYWGRTRPHWFWVLDFRYSRYALRPFRKMIWAWQKFVYRRAYKIALAKYPYIHDEIMCAADAAELLGDL